MMLYTKEYTTVVSEMYLVQPHMIGQRSVEYMHRNSRLTLHWILRDIRAVWESCMAASLQQWGYYRNTGEKD